MSDENDVPASDESDRSPTAEIAVPIRDGTIIMLDDTSDNEPQLFASTLLGRIYAHQTQHWNPEAITTTIARAMNDDKEGASDE